MELTDGLGVDVAVEAVGVADTFESAPSLCGPAGASRTSASGHSATLHLETLWIRDIDDHDRSRRHVHDAAVSQLIARGGSRRDCRRNPHFPLSETMSAYDTFGDAAHTRALKVENVLNGQPGRRSSRSRHGRGSWLASAVLAPAVRSDTSSSSRASAHEKAGDPVACVRYCTD